MKHLIDNLKMSIDDINNKIRVYQSVGSYEDAVKYLLRDNKSSNDNNNPG